MEQSKGPGTVLGTGYQENCSLGAESIGRRGNSACCSGARIDKYTGHLGTQVYSGQEGREGKKGKVPDTPRTGGQSYRLGRPFARAGVDGDFWGQEWHNKALRCVEGLAHSGIAKGEARQVG